ncbi:sugar phosphate isomerase/epimerase [Spirillospora sp. NBC_00431]
MTGTRFSDKQDVFFAHAHLVGSVWWEPVRDTFEERVTAVASVGSTGMGMATKELDDLLRTRAPEDLRAILDAHGVRIGELEILFGWQADAGSEEAVTGQVSEKAVFHYAEVFGATRVKTLAVMTPDAEVPPLDVLTERFAAMCDRAAGHGLTVAVEPVAFLPRFDHALAAAMVMGAERPNGGLLLDSWQTFRDPTGLDALDRVEARHITHVELADGHATPEGSVQEDCFHSRLLPGEGDFDLAGFVRTLDAKGVDVDDLSVEVLSWKLRTLTPQENVEVSVAAVRDVLAAARTPF